MSIEIEAPGASPITLETATSEELLSALDEPSTFEEAYAEAKRRFRGNFTNRHFGFFLLAVSMGNIELELQSYMHLQRLAFGILKKAWSGHFWHPDHPNVWHQCISDVLAAEVQKHGGLRPAEVLERMSENGFAYVYIALKREFIDEWRNLYRRQGRDVQFDDAIGYTCTSSITPEELDDIARAFEEQAEQRPELAAVLQQYAAYERDPDGWEAMYGKFPRAVSKAVAEANGVTRRTAQRYVATVKEEAQRNEELQAIKARLRRALDGGIRTIVTTKKAKPPILDEDHDVSETEKQSEGGSFSEERERINELEAE
jgi:hypothetical protein